MEEAGASRILLKLSGEALAGDQPFGIAPDMLEYVGGEVKAARTAGAELGLVVGGGNLFRGGELQRGGLDRITGDHMGMLATVMNALALADALRRSGEEAVVMTAVSMPSIAEPYDRRRAVALLREGVTVIFAAGTGNPLFTTDSAACLRAIEIGADAFWKATKVDGVYAADPVEVPTARKYEHLTYDDVIDQRLGVMDLTAVVLARDHNLPVRVFALSERGVLARMLAGEALGTVIGGAATSP